MHTNDYDYAVPPETLTDADLNGAGLDGQPSRALAGDASRYTTVAS